MAGPIIGLGEILWDLLPTGPRAGGAPFNFAFHCHQLGHEAVIVSRVGDDEPGHALRAEVRRLGLSDEYIRTDPAHPTGTVQVSVDADGQPSYTIADHVAWDYPEWYDALGPLSRSARVFCYGSLAQRHEPGRNFLRRLLPTSGRNRIKVCDLNLRPPTPGRELIRELISRADWLKVNADEFEVVRNFPEAGPGRLKLLCITRGADGCRVESGGQAVDLPGMPVKVADAVGAGDAFTAGLVTQTLEGKPVAEAARFANALAALVASRPGGTPRIDRAEVERLC